jgi:hypothetical protein
MKTAMQELIQWIDNDFRKQSTIPTIQQLKNKAEYLLEKEKEQIIDAFEYGQINVNEDGCLSTEDGAREYYDEKYTEYRKLPKDVKDWLNKI